MTGSSGGSGWGAFWQWLGLWVLGIFVGNWSKLRPAGWANKSQLLSAEMQDFDTFSTQVPNFMGGSNHYAQAPVILGGNGLILNGGLAAGAAQPLICIAFPTSGADGLQATADGAGIGGRFVGGNASGVGVKGTGGGPNGYGFLGYGTGTAAGGEFTGGGGSGSGGGGGVIGFGQGSPGGAFTAAAVAGGANSSGVTAQGVGTGDGATCTGGATGNGASCTAGGGIAIGCLGVSPGSGAGLAGVSFGTGAGVLGIGGTGAPGGSFAAVGVTPNVSFPAGVIAIGLSTAPGVDALGGSGGHGVNAAAGGANAFGVNALGHGTGPGVNAVGGTTGPGVTGTPGTAGQPALVAHSGSLLIDSNWGSTSTDPGKNVVTGEMPNKAWGWCESDGAHGIFVWTGVGVASATVDSSQKVTVTLAHAMTGSLGGTCWDVTVTYQGGGLVVPVVNCHTTGPSTFEFVIYDVASGMPVKVNFYTSTYPFSFSVRGYHA